MSEGDSNRSGDDGSAERPEPDAEEDSLMDVSELEEEPAHGAAAAGAVPERPEECTLAELLRSFVKLPVNEALGIARELGRELEKTWDQDEKTVRVDMRPGNILVKRSGEVRIARPEERDKSGAPAPKDDPICAEYNYVSPEKLKGVPLDGRADIYALGVLLYRMVTGEFHYKGHDWHSITKARLEGRPRPAGEVNPDVPDAVSDIIETMLATDLAFRYPDPTEFLRDAKLILEGPEVESDVGTAIMEKSEIKKGSSETETPAAGTPTAEARAAKEAAHKDRAGLLEPDAWKEAEPSGGKKGPAAKPLKMEERFPAPHAKGDEVGARPVRERLLVPAAMMSAAIVLVVVGIVVWSLTSPSDTATGVEGEGAPGGGDLEAEAQARYGDLLKACAGGEYERVVKEIDSFGGKFAGTAQAAEFKALHKMAADKLAEAAEREAEEERKRTLEARGAAFCSARQAEYVAGQYQMVVTAVDADGERYAATSHADKIRSLADDARKKLDEAMRREEARAETERRYWEIVLRAREEIARGDHKAARESLRQARGLKDTEEVAALAEKATRMDCLVQGEAAEKAGKIEEALEHYRKAHSVRRDDELAARVAALEGQVRFGSLLAKAEARASGKDWRGALNFYLKALSCAADEDREVVELAIEKARSETAYGDAIARARSALEAERWGEAIKLTRAVLGIRPGDEDARKIAAAAEEKLGPPKKIRNSIGMDFVFVPGGEFLMGSLGGDPDEGPVTRAHVDSYYIGVNEVTNAQYEEFNRSRKDERTIYSPADDMPVVLVSWLDAAAFCAWLSEKEGVEYRLPTEAEWEKAARGLKGHMYPWGSTAPGSGGSWRCNIAAGRTLEAWGMDGHKYASPVGSYGLFASPFKARDMSGNVWEWCQDWYRADSYSGGDKRNPTGPETGKQRVLRGGSFANDARAARPANRTAKKPDYREASIGFRCVRAVGPARETDEAGADR